MDRMSKEQRSRCMSRIRGKDTKPEIIVRRWLWARGYRFRKNVRRLPGTPDIVLRKYGIVIFVHGCFWHGHESHKHIPQTNKDYWEAKISRNKKRDKMRQIQLQEMGWNVLTVWECQLVPSKRCQTLAMIEYYINHSYLLKSRAASDMEYGEIHPESLTAAEPPATYGDDEGA